ncbi:hypothetical protein MSNKSG1_00893 [Marinobacter santoriniensis NKSG1]|uniref:Uncharacterized protein n=1 Tax=Marinobacter santoriniensis NKSG1 TaxID=1288826 RepID=M7CY07_9GAMM|nr:hypothetical protein [Marinobacter santoriniensis]EMP57135.1 hypothetical protein MSNKSG1_00893 [Marinobacter santoriniensis NKSG1]
MHKDLVAKLRADFPLLMHQGEENSFTRFGIEAGLGWFPIIYELFAVCEDIQQRTGKAVQISQIKEKFGSLRLYVNLPVDLMEEDIIEAIFESLSTKICDICGEPGSLGSIDGYWCTRCPDHRDMSSYSVDDERDLLKATRDRFIDYTREGLDTYGICYIRAERSGKDDGNAALKVYKLPDRILSLRDKSLIEQCDVSEHAGSPESLQEIVRDLKSKHKLLGCSDGSDEGRAVLDRL